MSPWWFYLVAILAALLVVNGIPHFISGLSGKQFPTPFSGGPGTLDSAVRNVLWGAGNLIVGGFLLWLIRDGLGDPLLVIELLAIGVAFAALMGFAFSHPERFGRKR
jgi:hypothetical protein